MERYALLRHLQRQRQFIRRMAPGQRLGTYVAHHRLLPAAIGPMPELSAPAALPWHAVADREPRVVQHVDAVQTMLEQAEPESWPAPVQEMRQLPNFGPPQSAPLPVYPPTQVEKSFEASAPTVAQTRADEARQHIWQQEQTGTEVVLPAPGPIEQTLDVSEARHAAPEKHERHSDQHGQPSTRRARIEERPQPSPHASAAHQMQASAEMRQQVRSAHPMKKAEPKTEEQNRAEREAAALFTSNGPGRSPQEWFAFLMQAARKQQPNGKAQVASQPENKLNFTQPARAVQPEPATRRLVPSDNTAQPEPIARPGQSDNATEPAPSTRQRQSISAVRPVAYSGDKPQPMQNNSVLSASERTASPFLPASAPGRTGTVQFVPAQQISSNQNGENVGDADANVHNGSAPEPLSLRARQVLKPMVGFDPADARIHRGPAAARFASAKRADAVTVGDDIYLAAEHANDEPETLGLLAHELTHVTRHHEPRSVPPVLSSRHVSAAAIQGAPVSRHNETMSASDEMLATADEEALAESVERQVTLRARDAAEASTRAASPTSAAPAFTAQSTQAVQSQQSREGQNSWGSLPAPWEPLPDWLAASSSTPTRSADMFTALPQAQQSLPTHFERGGNGQQSIANASAPGSAGRAQGVPAAQRAGRERRQATAEEQADWQEPPMQQHEPEPDLDKLARQVYAVLKRKIEVERRRMS